MRKGGGVLLIIYNDENSGLSSWGLSWLNVQRCPTRTRGYSIPGNG